MPDASPAPLGSLEPQPRPAAAERLALGQRMRANTRTGLQFLLTSVAFNLLACGFGWLVRGKLQDHHKELQSFEGFYLLCMGIFGFFGLGTGFVSVIYLISAGIEWTGRLFWRGKRRKQDL
jgi:hypothetical protein